MFFKNVLLKISQNLQKNTCDGVPIKYSSQALTLLKGDFSADVFPGNFCEIFKNIYTVEYLQRLILPSSSERFNVQYFNFGGFWKAAWINNKLLLHFLHKKDN